MQLLEYIFNFICSSIYVRLLALIYKFLYSIVGSNISRSSTNNKGWKVVYKYYFTAKNLTIKIVIIRINITVKLLKKLRSSAPKIRELSLNALVIIYSSLYLNIIL
ncbi:hypothetical protein B0T13DRAFT_446857 [Neurospora crassa]|nr:hypothetical protein B0T13DRAFT_446857 [Neurospora crassa]